MLFINIFVCIPLSCKEGKPLADDLTIKECGEGRELFCKSFDLQVATEVRVFLVNMLHEKIGKNQYKSNGNNNVLKYLEYDFDIVTVAFRFLVTLKSASVIQQTFCYTWLLRIGWWRDTNVFCFARHIDNSQYL